MEAIDKATFKMGLLGFVTQLTTVLYRKQLGNVPCRLANGVFREPLKTVMVNITV